MIWGACSAMPDSLRPLELLPARLPCPWNFPGKNARVVAISYTREPPYPETELTSLVSPALAGRFFTTVTWEIPQ